MYDMMKKQNFGVEIELTGITREQAANVIATYFGTQARYLGTYYNTYEARVRSGDSLVLDRGHGDLGNANQRATVLIHQVVYMAIGIDHSRLPPYATSAVST